MPKDVPAPPVPFADLLKHLFEHRRKPDGRKFTPYEVAPALPGNLSPSSIYRMLSGKDKNPSLIVLWSLAQFFDVDPSYFFPDLANQSHAPLPDFSIEPYLRSDE